MSLLDHGSETLQRLSALDARAEEVQARLQADLQALEACRAEAAAEIRETLERLRALAGSRDEARTVVASAADRASAGLSRLEAAAASGREAQHAQVEGVRARLQALSATLDRCSTRLVDLESEAGRRLAAATERATTLLAAACAGMDGTSTWLAEEWLPRLRQVAGTVAERKVQLQRLSDEAAARAGEQGDRAIADLEALAPRTRAAVASAGSRVQEAAVEALNEVHAAQRALAEEQSARARSTAQEVRRLVEGVQAMLSDLQAGCNRFETVASAGNRALDAVLALSADFPGVLDSR